MSERRICSASEQEFVVADEDLEFYRKISPTIGGMKFAVPAPRLSPDERQRRRLSFRNLRNLYRRKCDLSGRDIISMYRPDSPYKIYCAEEWWSDRWDPFDYGREFDFNRPFFEQFDEFLKTVPQIHSYVTHSENCDYINGAAHCKDCYLCFNMDYCERCYYLTNATNCLNCLDSLNLSRCEACYECVDCQNSFGLSHSTRCVNCHDSQFLSDCRQCRNCIACANLVNKENCLFNEQVNPSELERVRRTLGTRAGLAAFSAQARDYNLQHPRKYYFGHSNESFSGGYL